MAAKSQLRFQYGKHSDGQWYWHLRSRNGKIVAQGEGYKSKVGVLKVYHILVAEAAHAELVHVI